MLFLDRHSRVDVISTDDDRSQEEIASTTAPPGKAADRPARVDRRSTSSLCFRITNDLESRRLRNVAADATVTTSERERGPEEEACVLEAPTRVDYVSWVSIIGAALTRLQIRPLRTLSLIHI